MLRSIGFLNGVENYCNDDEPRVKIEDNDNR